MNSYCKSDKNFIKPIDFYEWIFKKSSNNNFYESNEVSSFPCLFRKS